MSQLRKVTPLQWLGILILFNGTLIGGSQYLKDMMIPTTVVTAMVAFAGLVNMFLGGLVTMFSSQSQQVQTVAAMPGIERIDVNTQASQALAQLATNPAVDKIAPTPAAIDEVTKTAKGG